LLPITPNKNNIKNFYSDTGATGNYIAFKDISLLANLRIATQPISVTLPDGSKATSSHIAELNFPHLAPQARIAHVFPTFTSSLISTGVLCDAGYTTTYDKQKVHVRDHKGTIMLTGTRDTQTGMWNYDSDAHTSIPDNRAMAAAIYPSELIQTKQHLAYWYHACMGSPAIPTFIQAIANEWIELPDLTATMARKIHPTVATHLGHLNQKRQHLDSTQIIYKDSTTQMTNELSNDDEQSFLKDQDTSSPTLKSPTYVQFSQVDNAKLHADLTGKFTVQSRAGHEYQLIMFNPDTNYIKVIPQKTRSHTDYISTYQMAIEFWTSHNIHPDFLLIDNEASQDLLTFLNTKGINVQMCPPGMHRTLRAERAIRTWKDHLLATLAII